MLPAIITLGPIAAAVADWFSASAIPVSGTALTLAQTAVATPRRVLLSYGNEVSARTLRLTGTNAAGNPIRETLAVPSGGAGTVYSIQDFLTISEAMPLGSGWTAAATLGTNGVASTPWKLCNYRYQPVTNIMFSGVASGTISWGIEITYDDPNNNSNTVGSSVLGNYPTPPTPWTLAALTAQAGNANASINYAISAWRGVLLSGTGSVVVTTLEGGIAVA